jgi:hypothetical protein
MSDDLSRFLQQPIKHYSSARLQQGRVLLDSDFNEAAWLEEEDARRAWVDVVGPQGSPDAGFTLGPVRSELDEDELDDPPPLASLVASNVVVNGVTQSLYDVTLRPGTLFVGGRRFDLESLVSVASQRDFLQLGPAPLGDPQPLDTLPRALTDGSQFRHLYYLHAWDQSVTATEDQELVEPMLRGPDTSVRLRRMRRVQVLAVTADDCEEAFLELVGTESEPGRLTQGGHAVFDGANFELRSNARLQLTFDETETVGDACAPCLPEDPVYLGSENTTLKILLTAPDRFVWALDNATPLLRVKVTGLAGSAPLEVEMLTPPTDERQLPTPNRVVELIPFGALLDGSGLPAEANDPHFGKVAAELGVFARVLDLDRASWTFTLRQDTAADTAAIDAIKALVWQWDANHPDAARLNGDNTENVRYFYLRLWHQTAQADTAIDLPAASSAVTATPLADTGVKPVFNQLGLRGDYWIASLRLDTPGRVVPFELTEDGGAAPHGPRHLYTPLALVRGTHANTGSSTPAALLNNGECRARLRKIGDQGCVTVTVGDGVVSAGDYRSIQQAIESLPGSGGRIAVRPGHYEERILIEGRRNVTLEGCGAATVITSPDGSNGGILLEVRSSEGIELSGLTLEAAEQIAVAARRVSDFALRDVTAIAGSFPEPASGADEPAFAREKTFSTAPLVQLVQVGSAELQELVLRPAQRPGLSLVRCELVTIDRLKATGTRVAEAPPSGPLVTLMNCDLVRMDDSTLEAFGQVGVAVRGTLSRDIELRDLVVHGSTCEFRPARDPDEPSVELPFEIASAEPGIDVENGDGIRVHRSRVLLRGGIVSEHACVVVHGRNVSVEGNVIETSFACDPLVADHGPQGESGDETIPDPLATSPESPDTDPNFDVGFCGAFGGIQVRGGSSTVEIRGNRIQNGLGHGITLGSVLWHDSDEPPSRARRVGGAGTGQLAREPFVFGEGFEDFVVIGRDLGAGFQDEGNQLLPVSEGTISDLVIADNTIQGMYGSGISVLTVLGLLARSTAFIEVEGGRIEGNRIEGNLVRLGKSLPDIGDVFPFPGSVYGPTVISVLPFGGIVLGAATNGVDIRNNVVRNNATSSDNAPLPVCGIFVLHGEGISIAGNRVTDNGFHSPVPVPDLRPGVRAGIAVMFAGTATADDLNDVRRRLSGRTALRHPNSSLRVANNTVLQPEGRALHVVASGPVTIDGNYLASLGNHGAELQTDRYMIGDVVFVQDVGAPWEALGLASRVTSSGGSLALTGYSPAPHALDYLTNQQEESPWYFVGDGGQILFNNNQVVYDWDVTTLPSLRSRAPLAFFPAAIVGLDHVGVNGNQFALRLNGNATRPPLQVPRPSTPSQTMLIPEPMLAQLLVLGATVDVSRNRISENVGSVVLSMITNADIMNITSFNQTTHVNAAFVMTSALRAFSDPATDTEEERKVSKFLRNENNQVMFVKHWMDGATQLPNTLTDTSPGPPSAFLLRIRRTLRRNFLRVLQNQNR